MERVPAVKPQSKSEAKKPLKEIVTSSFYIPRPAYRRLKEIAAKEDMTLQDIYTESVNAWLLKRSEAPINPEDEEGSD